LSALRGPIVGRKNHYGSKSLRGTQVAALFYTLCETAKLSGIDPHAYLLRAVEAAIAARRSNATGGTRSGAVASGTARPGHGCGSSPSAGLVSKILHPWPTDRFDGRTRGRSPVR
jgi:hypothetical protein